MVHKTLPPKEDAITALLNTYDELETVFIRETSLAREELDFDSLWSE